MLGEAPRYDLTDQDGAPFGSNDVGSRVALANFIYTTCTDTCPMLTATMARIQEQLRAETLLGGKVVLLSFSIDPERDRPDVLKRYGERFGVDGGGWKLLTGNSDAVGRIAQDLKLGRPFIVPPSAQNPSVNIAHTNLFVLIDRSGQVRATYLADDLAPDIVVKDIKRLAENS